MSDFPTVRADRLLALLMLLRRRGRMTAADIARELEVSQRTVLRDIEALGATGVPVYAERGRHGGFALVGGFSDLADRIEEYRELGISEFIFGGFPNLEESTWVGEGLLPELRSRGLLAGAVRETVAA